MAANPCAPPPAGARYGSSSACHVAWERGAVVELPQRRDFGSRLIERGLARELDGEVRTECNAAGLICTADRPILNTDTAGFER